MIEFLRKLFSSDFMPHGYCYLWTPGIIWLHAVSDATIALSYYLIPLGLIYFVRKRRDPPFYSIFLLFRLFTFASGTTPLIGGLFRCARPSLPSGAANATSPA